MERSIPWIEKYRPSSLSNMMLDPQIITQIKVFIQNVANTHLIITGLPGIGKTSAVKCIAKEILGANITDCYLELNAAEDRGVKSISAIVPQFCKKIINGTDSKIILFDEAENLTPKCQSDINNMIKQFGSRTKFIFTCNDSSKIIEDIQSVCRIIRFKKLTDEQISTYLEKICQIEKITYNKAGFDTLCYISAGDLRCAVNNLQLTAYAYQNITKSNVLSVCKLPDPVEIKKILELCMKAEMLDAHAALDAVISDGYYFLDIVTCFIYVLTNNFDMGLDENIRLKIIDIIQQTKIVISSGIRSKLQLDAMIARIVKEFLK